MAKRGRKRKLGPEDRAIFEWEKDRILPENLRDEMETMWEIPQIYHFLQLTKDALNISHLSMYEVERMLLMPKASKQLAHVMTCLLSSPSTTKAKHQKVPPMPYEFWTNILMYKLRSWFKMYQTKHEDSVKVFDAIGVEPEFWKIFPNVSDIDRKSFLDFSFKQRVWILKTICDTALHSRKTLQEEISKQPSESQFETVLGIDRYGSRYIYFPQFLHNDLRVYKHCLDNEILSTVQKIEPKLESIVKKNSESKTTARQIAKKKRRKSRWSKGSLPDQKKFKTRKIVDRPNIPSSLDPSIVDSNSNSIDVPFCISSRCSSKASSELSMSSSFAKSSGYETLCGDGGDDSIIMKNLDENSKEKIKETVTECEKKLSENEKDNEQISRHFQHHKIINIGEKNLVTEEAVATNDSSIEVKNNDLTKISNFPAVDDLSKSSKTDDEKLEEMSSMNATKIIEKVKDLNSESLLTPVKDANTSKSDDEKLSENKNCDTLFDTECFNNVVGCNNFKKKLKEKEVEGNCSHSENDEVSDSALSNSVTRRSARIKYISEIKLEVEDAENMLDVFESEELSSIDLRDNFCRVSSPEAEEGYMYESIKDDWKVKDFNKLISDLRVSSFQLVADSLDSLKDLTEFISCDKTIPGNDIKAENFKRPNCEEKLLKRMKLLCTSLEKVESILKESTKKARNKLQREWNNFENGIFDDEDQDVIESKSGANRWLLGSQGYWTLETHGTTLSDPTLSTPGRDAAISTSGDEVSPYKTTSGSIETQTEAQTATDKNFEWNERIKECNEEENCKYSKKSSPGKEEKEETFSRKDGEKEKRKEEEEKYDKNETEVKQTKRVLRTRGISSYSEQLFYDESEEENLDDWTDIEAIYATPSAQITASSPTSPPKARESCNDTDEEDSDQDWILPSSRKRKRKRQSSNRRLKSFQYKLQNINHNAANVAPTSLTYPSKCTKALSQNPKHCTMISSQISQKTDIPSSVNIGNSCMKTESHDPNLHSVLDIKDEGPIYDSTGQELNPACLQPNYVVVSSGPAAPVTNYFVMQQNAPVTAVVQSNQFIQPTTFVPQMIPQVQPVSTEGYYVHPVNQPYLMQAQQGGIITSTPNQTFVSSSSSQIVYQQPQSMPHQQQQPGFVQYVTQSSQPRIINSMTLAPPRQVAYRMRGPFGNGSRMPVPRQLSNGAVIRSTPLQNNILRPGQRMNRGRAVSGRLKRQNIPRTPNPAKSKISTSKTGTQVTSLIVLSDSDDEIEMIIEEKSQTTPKRNILPKPAPQPILPKKTQLPAELMQRMSEGNISISPIKPTQSVVSTSQSTQLVVVVNETGSHYALALPNGSKLILTPEQVAQIRASNGGKLVL